MTMDEYPKIQSVYKRDERGTFIQDFSRPEFEYLYTNEWVFTEKVDGTNIRIGYDPTTGDSAIAGRTDNAQIPGPLLVRLQDIEYNLGRDCEELLDLNDAAITLYGEGYGPKIQKGGGRYGDHVDFVLFDVQIGDWWLRRESVEDVAETLGLDVVPVVGEGTLRLAEEVCFDGFYSRWGDFMAEGVVATPRVPLCSRDGDRIITKLKYADYEHIRRTECVA